MESRKMVLKNLFTRQQQTYRIDLWTWGEGQKGGDEWREEHGNLHYHMQNRQPTGICCIAQETQTGSVSI